MNGLGGLNKSPNGVVIGLVQLKLPEIATRSDIAAQTGKIVAMVGKAKQGMSTIDLVVFPEYALHGLSMGIRDEILCDLDGPEVAAIMLRTAGYTPPVRAAWQFTNQSNAFCNLMVTASVCMCGSDGTFDAMGEAMFCNFDGTIIAHGAQGRVDEVITAEVRPDLVREARAVWGVENNIYQFGHRGFAAVRGGAGGLSVYLHAGSCRRPVSPAVGGDCPGDGWHLLRDRGADAGLWRSGGEGGRIDSALRFARS
jgi:predicted amidohydrolase